MSPDEIRLTLLAEQRHAINDLDTDAQCVTYPGCVYVMCPPNRKRVIMRKLNAWHYLAWLTGFAIGVVLTAVLVIAAPPAHSTTVPPCGTGARILCGTKPLPKHTPAKPGKQRISGPVFRGQR